MDQPVFVIFLLGAILSFAGACFPRWRFWWCRHGGFGSGERVSVSRRGRIAMGCWMLYVAVGAYFRTAIRPYWYLFMAIAVVQMVGMWFVYAHDRDRDEGDQSDKWAGR